MWSTFSRKTANKRHWPLVVKKVNREKFPFKSTRRNETYLSRKIDHPIAPFLYKSDFTRVHYSCKNFKCIFLIKLTPVWRICILMLGCKKLTFQFNQSSSVKLFKILLRSADLQFLTCYQFSLVNKEYSPALKEVYLNLSRFRCCKITRHCFNFIDWRRTSLLSSSGIWET